MKKILISTITLLVSVMVMATETAYFEITLTGASGGNSTVSLTEDDARTAAYESGYDVASMMALANTKSVLIYGLVGTDSCEAVATNDLNEFKIGFTSNKVDDHYTLSFSNFSGRTLYLYDLVAEEIITINGSTPAYNFTIPSAGRAIFANRFVIKDSAPSGNLETCFTGTELQISNNPYYGAITITPVGGGSPTVLPYMASGTIDLSDAGEFPNGDYTVQVGSGASSRKFIITVKH